MSKEKIIERLVIIDHESHELFIEDVDEDLINEKFNGKEEDYIKSRYALSDNWSWEYVNMITYMPPKGDGIIWFNDQYLELPE